MYEYKAIVRRVYDGDTVILDIDLGFSIWMIKETIRLSDTYAYEIRGKERPLGLKVKDYLESLVLDKEVTIRTEKDKTGKYGRILATLYLDGENVNEKVTAYQKSLDELEDCNNLGD